MSNVRDITLIFFVTYLSPQKPKACAAKLNFGWVFSKVCPLKSGCHVRRALGHPRFIFSLTF